MSNVDNGRKLLIIGNGFDLHLKLNSSFKDYLGMHTTKDFYKHNSVYRQISHFIKTFHLYESKIDRELTRIEFKGSLHLRGINLKDHQGHYENLFIHNRTFVRTYLNIRMYITKDYKLYDMFRDTPFLHFLNYSNKKSYNSRILSLRKKFSLLNHQTDSYINKLKEMANTINTDPYGKVNFFELLMLCCEYIHIHYDNIDKNHHNKIREWDWYDIENMIKEFIMSILNHPIHKSIRSNKYFKVNEYKNIWNYFPESSLSSEIYFMNFTYINSYINLLRDLKKFTNDRVSDSNNLYDLYSYTINHSNFYELMIKEFPNYDSYNDDKLFSSLRNDARISDPFIFLLCNKLGFNMSPNNNYKYFFKYLRNQLHQFEYNFGRYLQHRININPHYDTQSHHLLNELANNKNNDYSVLDFNYTPIDGRVHNVEHIHGSLNKRKKSTLVIGVGEQEIDNLRNKLTNNSINKDYYSELYSFTKTYRLFSFNRKDDKDFLDDINSIVFYGHSLGVNDYPYFEALFDHFKLYSNPNITLVFCYSRHNNISKSAIRRKQIPKIVHLLKQYSKSIDNKYHGENLISKMFMENRIKLRYIK